MNTSLPAILAAALVVLPGYCLFTKHPIVRGIATMVLGAFVLFSSFGFAATFELPVERRIPWQIGYASIVLSSIALLVLSAFRHHARSVTSNRR